MKSWPKYPVIYEINTWVWLDELGRKYNKPLTLASVPSQEWDILSSFKFDAIWFMGVWQRSPAGKRIAMDHPGIMSDMRTALPDFQLEDVAGSPYCIRNYVADLHLGGPEGLKKARASLRERGLRLILDFVPNHVAPDHPWTREHPDYFIQGNEDDLKKDPSSYLAIDRTVFARGRDPNYPAWPDVLQLNAFHDGLRNATIETILQIAAQCDGIRCDMSMLLLNDVFEKTWGLRAGQKPAGEFWSTVIPAVKNDHPEFRFIAEAYWDLERELQQLGFDFCYDKKLYDLIRQYSPVGIHDSLKVDPDYRDRLVLFIENHDEMRAAAAFSKEEEYAAALMIMTLPGARMLHEGQFEGRRIRLPVFLGRRPVEKPDQKLMDFYNLLLNHTGSGIFREGQWRLSEVTGWPGNNGSRNILSWAWMEDLEIYLVVINFSKEAVQARIVVPLDEIRGKIWVLEDVLSEFSFERKGDEMCDPGLYVAMEPWKFNFFKLSAKKIVPSL
jgi:glycosidase